MDHDAAFKELTKRSGIILRAHDFKGSGQNFKREIDDVWQLVNFQRSPWRVDRTWPISFTLNLCTYFPKLKTKREGRVPSTLAKFTEPVADLRLRVGHFLAKGNDKWWDLDDADLTTFWPKFEEVLVKTVIPTMKLISTPRGLASVCRSKPVVRGWLSGTAEAWLRKHKAGPR